MKTEYREKEQQPCCYFHQEQVVIGVCPFCLNERLVILAAKQLDSFISIKFEENGVPSWEESKLVSNASLDYSNIPRSRSKGKGTTNSTVVELPMPRGGSLRWRKRIGLLFQLSRWKKPTKGSGVCHVGSSKVVEGVKVTSTGWIRSLTKRRRSGME
ncbi:hypothetical protein RHGRI_017041 [Rhododendron griersonianum]|uniref:Uncharacterized protein n=1 Tax=Rhododendron griersonianum TaxID=479676 RepID=A0AAV6JWG7_9ERIC|nr:hypothetical protein RHGRI_017041 [Rhododendron griersonianum]